MARKKQLCPYCGAKLRTIGVFGVPTCDVCVLAGKQIGFDQRYQKGPGKMDAYLPGGTKYTGALFTDERPASG